MGDRSGEAVTRYNLAGIYVSMGDLAKAEEELLLVVELDEAVGHPDLESDRQTLLMVQAMRKQSNG